MKEILSALKDRQSLEFDQMTGAMEAVVSGRLSTDIVEQFLLLLRDKGETVDEIAAAVLVMNHYKKRLSRDYPDALDTCGTGGDCLSTLNISTLAAIILASGGVQVAKHGNRSVSSVCGSADLLELCGVKIELSLERVERCLEEVGFGFFFAPIFHPAMRHAMPARKKIQGKTIFNILGPLSNPVNSKHQLIGVYREDLVETIALVLKKMGTRKALVVYGRDGLDEITTSHATMAADLSGGKIKIYDIWPEDYGITKISTLTPIQCQTKEECKQLALKVLGGQADGPCEDIVCLNAAAAFFVSGRAHSIAEGVEMARVEITSGRAMEKLEQIAAFTAQDEAAGC